MTSAYRPLAEDLLLLDAAKKDSTAPSNARCQAMRNLLYRKDS
jgi:hypothetical protein